MSNKNKSKKPSTKGHHVEQGRRKIVTDGPARVEREEEEPRDTAKPTPAPNSTPVQKLADAPVAKPKIQETPWSDWIWDDGSGQWYRARLGPDKTWQYDFPDPPVPVLIPSPVPQFAPSERIEYSEPETKVMFANEVMYQVPDSRGGYLLAVRQDKCVWNVEEALSPTKTKEGPKKADSGAEKKDGGETKAAAPDAAAGPKPPAEEKAPVKASAEPVEGKPVAETSSTKKTKAASGPAPESSKKQLPEKEKKSKQSSKPKKTAYIESDEEDEPRHRGRQRERRK